MEGSQQTVCLFESYFGSAPNRFDFMFLKYFANKAWIPLLLLPMKKLLLSIIGGLLTGVGCAICLRGGASSGGMDILAQYIS
jgi:uncharacterized membrane-anchored protein YitT (DUF2179 family)